MSVKIDNKIGSIVDKHLLWQQERSEKREKSGRWHPSSFGKCYRSQYWQRLNEPKSNVLEAKTLRVFAIGKIIHSFIQNIVSKYEYSIIESVIDNEDVLAFVDIVGIDEVIEIKSVRSFGFRMIKKEGFDLVRDKEPELLQALYYGVKKEKKQVRLVFVDKDTLEFMEFVVEVEPFVPLLKIEFEILNAYWDKKELPPMLPRAYKGKECKYCGYANKCKTEREENNGDTANREE